MLRKLRRTRERLDRDLAFELRFRPNMVEEASQSGLFQLHIGLVVFHADLADLGLFQIASTTQKRQQPTRLCPLGAPHRQGNPCRRAKFCTRVLRTFCRMDIQLFGCGQTCAIETQASDSNLFGAVTLQQFRSKSRIRVTQLLCPSRIFHDPAFVERKDVFRRRRMFPLGVNFRPFQQARGFLCHVIRCDEDRGAFASGTTCPTRTVQKPLGIGRQIGMDHQFQIGQVNPARRHISGHTDTGPTVTQRLKRMGTLVLRQLARQAHHREPAIGKPCRQTRHCGAGVCKHDRGLAVVKPQQVDDRMFGITRRTLDDLVRDIRVLALFRNRCDTHSIALIGLGDMADGFGHGCREQERATIFGRFAQHELKIFAKAEIKHLVGFIKNNGPNARQIQRAARDMIAQASGRAHNNMRTTFQSPTLGAGVHTADTGRYPRTGFGIKPHQFAADLHRKLAGRCHNKRQGATCVVKAFGFPQKRWRNGKTKAHGLAGPRLGGNQQIGLSKLGCGDGRLNVGQSVIATLGKRVG